jgi:hypothetical protein
MVLIMRPSFTGNRKLALGVCARAVAMFKQRAKPQHTRGITDKKAKDQDKNMILGSQQANITV